MRFSPVVLTPLFLCPVVCVAENEPAHDTHQKIAEDLINLLSETELALSGCQDKASVEAAIPRFRELAAVADSLAARQAAISAPTVQDDMAAVRYVDDFNLLWNAICAHISRLEKAGLISDALRDVLKIAPAATPAPAQPRTEETET